MTDTWIFQRFKYTKKCVLEFIKYAVSLFICAISIYKRDKGSDYYVSGTGFTDFTVITFNVLFI